MTDALDAELIPLGALTDGDSATGISELRLDGEAWVAGAVVFADCSSLLASDATASGPDAAAILVACDDFVAAYIDTTGSSSVCTKSTFPTSESIDGTADRERVKIRLRYITTDTWRGELSTDDGTSWTPLAEDLNHTLAATHYGFAFFGPQTSALAFGVVGGPQAAA